MCAFWFHYIFELPFLPDYIMRLDTDSCITSNMVVNSFQYMQAHGLDYMYNFIYMESAAINKGLRDLVDQHPGQTVNNDKADSLWQSGYSGKMNTFSTNLEWVLCTSLLTTAYSGLEGGSQTKWWNNLPLLGDAPLQTIVATTLLNSSHIARFCTFSYNHSTWLPLHACVGNADSLVKNFGWNILYYNGKTVVHQLYG